MRMAKLKTLTEEKFTKLYEEIPVVILSKELDIDENPIMKRAKKYGLHKKFGRPERKEVKFKDENSWMRYSPEITDILIEALMNDGATNERLKEKGYPELLKEHKLNYQFPYQYKINFHHDEVNPIFYT